MVRIGIGNQLLLAVAVFFLPLSASASVIITEIMYDASGADTKREWIEIFNSGDIAVPLSEWKLYEGGVNHKLVVYSGDLELKSGAYAVIASDAETFVDEHPNFIGVLFDSAFTSGLKNSEGEELVLRNATFADIDSISYTPALGASGDGNSLQRVGNAWLALQPTPGGPADPSKKIIAPPEVTPVPASPSQPIESEAETADVPDLPAETLPAAPVLAEASGGLPYWAWFLMLAGVIGVGIGVAHLIRKKLST